MRKKLGELAASKITKIEKSATITSDGVLTATTTPAADCIACVSAVGGGGSDSIGGVTVTGAYETVNAAAKFLS